MTDEQLAARQRFAHALLSPLTVVVGAIEMLLNQADAWPAYARELLQSALAQGRRLQATLMSLVAAAEIDGDTVRVTWPTVATRRAFARAAPEGKAPLPGNVVIERAVWQRIASGAVFAVCYADLDSLRAYNEVYGFAKGDEVIQQVGQILRQAVRELGNVDDLVGHISGDNFVVVTTPERADAICRRVVEVFDRTIPQYYDPDARARGYIETKDQRGQLARSPLLVIRLTVVSNRDRSIEHPARLLDLAAELQQQAEHTPGSSIVWCGAR